MSLDSKHGDLGKGFDDPVYESQSVFRSLLSALSRPGRQQQASLPLSPRPLQAATAAIALSLFDLETPVWLDATSDNEGVRDWLGFHCGCPLVPRPHQAVFALVCDAPEAPRLSQFNPGHEEYPERSTTIIFQVETLTAGPGVVLHGPGIETTQTVSIGGLPEWFWGEWRLNAARYPLGVDAVFVQGDNLLGLPRSVTTES